MRMQTTKYTRPHASVLYFEQFLCYVFHNVWRWLTHPLCGCCYRTIYVVSDCCLSIFKHCWLTARVLEKCFWGRGKSWNFLWRREWEPCSFVMPTYSCKCCGKCTVYTVVYIAKNGGGYTQRCVAKGLKVPCLFMITEVSIRCQKKPGGWYTAHTRVYPPNTPLRVHCWMTIVISATVV